MAMTNNKAFRRWSKWRKVDTDRANEYISHLMLTILRASYAYLRDARCKPNMLVEVFNSMKNNYRKNRRAIRKNHTLTAKDIAMFEFRCCLEGRKTYFVYYVNNKDYDGSIGFETFEACAEALKADPRFTGKDYEIREYLQGTGDYIKSYDIDGKITLI